MFQELNKLLASLTSLTLSLAANQDNTITVTVTPKGAKSGVLDTPLSLTGPAAELDECFAGILTGYTVKRQSLAEQAAATEAILEAAKKEAADKAKKSIAKPAKSSTSVVADDDENGKGSDDDADDESASNTAPTSTVSTSTPAVAASDASDLWA